MVKDVLTVEPSDTIGEAALERGLPRGILPEPGGDDVPHDAFVDERGIDACAADGFRNGPA